MIKLSHRAAAIERDGVDRALLAEMAAHGLLAITGPPELGGLDASGQRAVHEHLAGQSPDAWFVFFQHGPVVKALVETNNAALREAHLADLCRGRKQGGVAWSNLRRSQPAVTAVRAEGGWLLTGPQPWCTGWPLLDLVYVGALVPATHEVIFGVIDRGTAGLVAGKQLLLAAMAGTHTFAVAYDQLFLPDSSVTSRGPFDAWRSADRAGNANAQPATFGVALRALELLGPHPLRDRVLAVRQQAYALRDDEPRDAYLDQKLAVRAEALVLGISCATALLVSRGGRGMDLEDEAQRLLRAAAFQLVHSQDGAVRAATLQALHP